MKRRWQEGYRRPLEEAIDAATRQPGIPESPLMELIQSAAVTGFPGHADRAPRRLIIVSDFLQHTKDYSHYGSAPPRFEDFERGALARKVHPDLAGFDVRLLYLRRDGQERVQTAAHVEFWKRFFIWAGVGAGQLQIVRIEG
jgi:hypothetical protein